MARGIRAFLTAVLSIVLVALGAAALAKAVPLAQVAAAASLALAGVAFFAGRSGAPRWFGVRHLIGLLFGALAVWLHAVAWSGLAAAPALSGFDPEAALAAVKTPPGRWLEHLATLSSQIAFTAGGTVATGETLRIAWLCAAGLTLLCGFFGGHAAYWRPRARL